MNQPTEQPAYAWSSTGCTASRINPRRSAIKLHANLYPMWAAGEKKKTVRYVAVREGWILNGAGACAAPCLPPSLNQNHPWFSMHHARTANQIPAAAAAEYICVLDTYIHLTPYTVLLPCLPASRSVASCPSEVPLHSGQPAAYAHRNTRYICDHCSN